MKVLDLFSGIGGFSLGLEKAGMQTIAFCEKDTFCQEVLKKGWPHVPIHSDITELDGSDYNGAVELVCGGFPCQPFSVAGKRLGAEDDRSLWPEMLRIIREVAPRWVIGENVSGIISMELDKVLSDLEGEGYAVWTFIIPACAVDAHHRRDRVWFVAHSDSKRGRSGNPKRENASYAWQPSSNKREQPRGMGAWDVEPSICRVAHGVSNRTHRLKALGNAVVPMLVAEIGNIVMDFDHLNFKANQSP
jgi:DNA (cytosine-5)-methyltransferase 1